MCKKRNSRGRRERNRRKSVFSRQGNGTQPNNLLVYQEAEYYSFIFILCSDFVFRDDLQK